MSSNATCHMQGAPQKSSPLFQDGNLDIQGKQTSFMNWLVLTLVMQPTMYTLSLRLASIVPVLRISLGWKVNLWNTNYCRKHRVFLLISTCSGKIFVG